MKRILLATALIFSLALSACGGGEGFYTSGGDTYYRMANGENHIGFITNEGSLYYFLDDGRMIGTGLFEIAGDRYYFVDGAAQTGWQEIELGGEMQTYYFMTDGKALKGDYEINSVGHRFNESTGEYIGKLDELKNDTPSFTPSPTPPPSVSPTPEPTPEPWARSGETGLARLDDEVGKIVEEVCDTDEDAEHNLGELFDWMVEELRYKYVNVDLSEGYTDSLVDELAEYIILNRRGSCEHQAALMCVFIMRMGYQATVVEGEFLSDDRTEWVEHAWVIAEVDGEYYHFDPLFGRNHTNNPRSFFMKKDADIEALHRWERENYPVCE